MESPQHGFILLQSVGIIAGLFFSGAAFLLAIMSYRAQARERKAEADERKVQIRFVLLAQRREIWKAVREKPELRRVLDASLPADTIPTLEETDFVRDLILHLDASLQAQRAGISFSEPGLAADIRQFFSKPIPHAVWMEVKKYQDPDFVASAEKAMIL